MFLEIRWHCMHRIVVVAVFAACRNQQCPPCIYALRACCLAIEYTSMAACLSLYKEFTIHLSIVFDYQESFNFKRAIVHAPGRSAGQLQAIQSHENYNFADFHGCEHLVFKCKAVSTTRAWYVNYTEYI